MAQTQTPRHPRGCFEQVDQRITTKNLPNMLCLSARILFFKIIEILRKTRRNSHCYHVNVQILLCRVSLQPITNVQRSTPRTDFYLTNGELIRRRSFPYAIEFGRYTRGSATYSLYNNDLQHSLHFANSLRKTSYYLTLNYLQPQIHQCYGHQVLFSLSAPLAHSLSTFFLTLPVLVLGNS
jgi:hypothetical protein